MRKRIIWYFNDSQYLYYESYIYITENGTVLIIEKMVTLYRIVENR